MIGGDVSQIFRIGIFMGFIVASASAEKIYFHNGVELEESANLIINTRSFEIEGAHSIARDLVLDKHGRAWITGRISESGREEMLVARFSSDGSIDSSFAGRGHLAIEFGTGTQIAHSISLQADGKVVIAGRADPVSNQYFDFAIAKVLETGNLDLNFNGTGKRLERFGGSTDIGRAVRLQKDGKIWVVGYARDPHHVDPYQFASLRLMADGQLDLSYGSLGKKLDPVSKRDNGATASAIQEDGKLILAGVDAISGVNQLSVIRTYENGERDSSFNGTGLFSIPLGDSDSEISGDSVNAVEVDFKGRILVVGSLQREGEYRRAFVLRILPTGKIDFNFGNQGLLVLDNAYGETEFKDLKVTDQGQVIAVGSLCSGECSFEPSRILISKIKSNGRLNKSFGNRGVKTVIIHGKKEFADALDCTKYGQCVCGGRALNERGFMELALHQFWGGD